MSLILLPADLRIRTFIFRCKRSHLLDDAHSRLKGDISTLYTDERGTRTLHKFTGDETLAPRGMDLFELGTKGECVLRHISIPTHVGKPIMDGDGTSALDART